MKFIDENGKVRNHYERKLTRNDLDYTLWLIVLIFAIAMFASCGTANSFTFHKQRGTGAYCPR